MPYAGRSSSSSARALRSLRAIHLLPIDVWASVACLPYQGLHDLLTRRKAGRAGQRIARIREHDGEDQRVEVEMALARRQREVVDGQARAAAPRSPTARLRYRSFLKSR